MAALLGLGGCTLPRGAAIQSEILSESEAEEPSFAVVPVTRANMPSVAKWPATGWHGHYHWIDRTQGSNSSVIQPGDRLNLVIWDSQENSLLTSTTAKVVTMEGLEVSSAGTIFVPYAEDVNVRGLTPDGARKRIQGELESFVPSAQVQVSMESGQGNSVDLVGGVTRPGTYPLPNRNYSILSLLAQGGGVPDALPNPVVRLVRGSATYTIPAKTLYANASKNTTLRGNDKVIVEADDRTFTAIGATGSESLVPFPKEHVTALEALSLIGGLNDARANPKGILVLREYKTKDVRIDGSGPEKEQVIFTIDLTSADGLFAARNFTINPDDTVLATESPVNAARTVIGLVGTLIGFGGQVASATGP